MSDLTQNRIKENRLKGWNTWNVRSMLSHVLMPYGFAINIGIMEYSEGGFLPETLLGRLGNNNHAQRMHDDIEEVLPGSHSSKGDYTEVSVIWKGIEINVESGSIDDEIYIKITEVTNQKKPAVITAAPGIFWNNEGSIIKTGKSIEIQNKYHSVKLKMIGNPSKDCSIPITTPYLSAVLSKNTYFYTGEDKSIAQIEKILSDKRNEYDKHIEAYDDLKLFYKILTDTLAWNVIYDPTKDRILTIVGRTWSVEWGGYVQHCWDMYFNALMHSTSDRELAYNSVIEITREIAHEGFIPNCVAANGFATLDRSQPPVGSLVTWLIYEKYGEKWFIEEVFDSLYKWNGWYYNNRQVEPGVLGWGSTPYESLLDNYWESAGTGAFYGAAMESGLDNSPMYDNIKINPDTHTMLLADVGLTSLIITDTRKLIKMSKLLDKTEELNELETRLHVCTLGLEKLWSEDAGIYLNYRTDTEEFDNQVSPTNLYPLLTGFIPKPRVNKMVNDHLLNENKFWGEWVIPSISKDNPAFSDQDYWRGRIWAPMNLLVYLGLKETDMSEEAALLAEKSANLIMKEWLVNKHVHENYCALTGEGCNVENSEKYYSWGALLALIYIIENGK